MSVNVRSGPPRARRRLARPGSRHSGGRARESRGRALGARRRDAGRWEVARDGAWRSRRRCCACGCRCCTRRPTRRCAPTPTIPPGPAPRRRCGGRRARSRHPPQPDGDAPPRRPARSRPARRVRAPTPSHAASAHDRRNRSSCSCRPPPCARSSRCARGRPPRAPRARLCPSRAAVVDRPPRAQSPPPDPVRRRTPPAGPTPALRSRPPPLPRPAPRRRRWRRASDRSPRRWTRSCGGRCTTISWASAAPPPHAI